MSVSRWKRLVRCGRCGPNSSRRALPACRYAAAYFVLQLHANSWACFQNRKHRRLKKTLPRSSIWIDPSLACKLYSGRNRSLLSHASLSNAHLLSWLPLPAQLAPARAGYASLALCQSLMPAYWMSTIRRTRCFSISLSFRHGRASRSSMRASRTKATIS